MITNAWQVSKAARHINRAHAIRAPKVFLADSWDTATFVTSYLPIALYFVFFFGYKMIMRSKFIKYEEMDFETVCRNNSGYRPLAEALARTGKSSRHRGTGRSASQLRREVCDRTTPRELHADENSLQGLASAVLASTRCSLSKISPANFKGQ